MQGAKRILGVAALLAALTAAGAANAQGRSATVNLITADGVGAAIGTISFRDTKQGLYIEPKLTGLPPGPHGFHIHQNPNCGPGPGANNVSAPGMAAGGHYDPKGLPGIAKRLKTSDLAGRSVMIHAGSDNFDDAPAPLGGGGGRIACGVIK
jgi:Cu-Zn family superoxide dismutase